MARVTCPRHRKRKTTRNVYNNIHVLVRQVADDWYRTKRTGFHRNHSRAQHSVYVRRQKYKKPTSYNYIVLVTNVKVIRYVFVSFFSDTFESNDNIQHKWRDQNLYCSWQNNPAGLWSYKDHSLLKENQQFKNIFFTYNYEYGHFLLRI